MLWAFDIETHDWDVFVLGAAVSERGHVVRMHDRNAFREWYFGTDKHDLILCHNGGRFDMLFALDCLGRESGWVVRGAGSGLITAQYRDHGVFYDTFRMIPMALAKWAPKSEWDHKRTHPRMAQRDRAALEAYCVQDCRGLLDAWQRVTEWWLSLGAELRGTRGPRLTLGSLAWHTACAFAGSKPKRLTRLGYAQARAGYYGGRTEVYRARASFGYRFDLNSAYPAALLKPVPCGEPMPHGASTAGRCFRKGRPGVYHATVTLPEMRVPLLPHRSRGRLLWANGHITGAWVEPELRWAESQGARIERITSAQVYPRSEAIYAPFVERMYAERLKAKRDGDTFRDTWLKLFMNSLSGKLAERGKRTEYRLFAGLEDDLDGWEPVDRARLHWAHTHFDVPANAHPAQAGVVTASARIAVADRLLRAGGGALAIYCDTDSAYTITDDPTDVDDEAFGLWKREGGIWQWRALAPKMHAYQDPDSGQWKVRAKGIPLSGRQEHPNDNARAGELDKATFDALERGDAVTLERGVETFRMRLRSVDSERFFKKRKIARRLQQPAWLAGSRIIEPDGSTIPLTRRADGSYCWPGSDLEPAEYLDRIPQHAPNARRA